MPSDKPRSLSSAVARPARVDVETNRRELGNSARRSRRNSTHPAISPTETACNQIAPGPVCLKERGGKPKRCGSVRQYPRSPRQR